MAHETSRRSLAGGAEFNARERKWQALLRVDEDRADALHDSQSDMQSAALDRICNMPCTTREGMAALATSLLVWDREILIETDDPNADTNERLVAALLRALLPSGRV